MIFCVIFCSRTFFFAPLDLVFQSQADNLTYILQNKITVMTWVLEKKQQQALHRICRSISSYRCFAGV